MNVEKCLNIVRHPLEINLYKKIKKWFVAEDSFLEYFENNEEEGAMPDLYGKSVVAGAQQFSNVYNIIKSISNYLCINPPTCFIYDSQKCLVDSEGIANPRLEVSSRLINDFTNNELKHAIAKELYHIKVDHIRTEVLADKMINLLNVVPNLPGINLIKNFGGNLAFEATGFHFKSIAFNWFKYACYSADNFAISYTGNIEDSIRATLLCIFNERKLVESIDIKSFIGQIGKIESCVGPVATTEVINEIIPYSPYRILNMLRFVLSDNGRGLFSYFKANITN